MSSKKGDTMAKTQHLCMVLGVFVLSISAWSMEAMTIEQVYTQYNQSTIQLDAAAIGVIGDFWRKSMDTMMLSEDTEKMVELRLELKKYKGSDYLSFYSSAYQKASKEHLKEALDTVDKWENGVKKVRIERNLMILTVELGNVGLVDLALPKLSNKDPMVRYWAVRSLTSADVISQSKGEAVTRDDKRTAQIIAGLEDYLKTTPDTATISYVTNFAIEMNTAASRKMLSGIADRRIDAYMKWTVTDEHIDADILKGMGSLGVQISDPAEKQELLGRFGQMYAYVLERYMQPDKLPAGSRERLISTIVEVEDKIVVKQVPGWAAKFRADISTNKPLIDDYALLFGSNGQPGELAAKMNFNYGKDSSGKPVINPKPLPSAPVSAVETKTTEVEAKTPAVETKAPTAPEAKPAVPAAKPATPAAKPAAKP
jgi:hypothetical protein